MGGATNSDHWVELARRWEISGPPLRPSPEDVDAYHDAIDDVTTRDPSPRVLILGVTPELYRLPWPRGADVQAADRSSAMIELVWPGSRAAVHQEEWTALSFPDASRDVALCDGGFHLLSHPHGQHDLVGELRRVIARDGCFAVRLFVPPEEPEDPEAILQDLRDGRVRNANLLKLRLDMALQQDPREGVLLGDVWDVFHVAEPDPEPLASRIGWRIDEVRSLEAYKEARARYHFVSVDQVEEMFCRDPGGFSLQSVRVPSYELGERCPLMVLRRL